MEKMENRKKRVKIPKNMYQDARHRWNVMVGCEFNCIYCEKSFKAQMKRQKHNCIDCYDYTPHFHENRLKNKLPRTYGDEFIWCCSSSDIAFAEEKWIRAIIERIKEMPNRTFFFQTKDPCCFNLYDFPKNVMLGITLETDRSYNSISKAPEPYKRYIEFLRVNHPRKVVTIEPILDFDGFLLDWIKEIGPEKVYIGFDTKKCNLPEPQLWRVRLLISELSKFTKVKTKYMKEAD